MGSLAANLASTVSRVKHLRKVGLDYMARLQPTYTSAHLFGVPIPEGYDCYRHPARLKNDVKQDQLGGKKILVDIKKI